MVERRGASVIHPESIDSIDSEVTSLCLEGITGPSLKGLLRLPRLQSIEIRSQVGGPQVGDEVLPILAQIVGLRRLSFDNWHGRGHGLSSLAILPNLEALSIRFTRVDETGLSEIAALGQLSELSLDISLPGAAFSFVGKLRKLRSLSLQFPEPVGGVFKSIGQLDQLESLHVNTGEPCLDDECVRELGRCTALRELKLFPCDRLTDKAVSFLEDLPDLENLDLRRYSPSDIAIAHFANMKSLKSLHMPLQQRLTIAGIQGLARCRALTELLLGYPDITIDDAALVDFRGHPRLENVELAGCAIGMAGIEVCASMPELRRLDISRNKSLADEALAPLPGARKLRYLNLAHCENLTGAVISHLVAIPSLRFLYLNGIDGISGTDLASLKQLKDLTVLGLGFLELEVSHLGFLSEFPKLRELDLNCTHLSDEVVPVLAATSLTHINLAGSDITEEGLSRLVSELKPVWLGLELCDKVSWEFREKLQDRVQIDRRDSAIDEDADYKYQDPPS